MLLATFPFVYYSALSESTLATKIREKTWNLDKLFALMQTTTAEMKRLAKIKKPSQTEMQKLRVVISNLAEEIGKTIKELKYISFYDSTIFYLYFKLLHHVMDLCKREEDRLREMETKNVSEAASRKGLGDIIKAKKDTEDKIREHERNVNELKTGERAIINDYEELYRELRRFRWDAEKQAQHEFSLLKLTLRSIKNLIRKIKVESLKVKKEIVPQEILLLRRIRNSERINPQDVVQLAKLVSDAISRISKDLRYSFKLIAKFEREMNKLKRVSERLKKKTDKVYKSGQKEDLMKPLEDAIRKVEDEINKDLMQIFRNIFVEFKRIAARPPKQLAA